MKEFVTAVLSFHPSTIPQSSSPYLFPKVSLTRLSYDTIKKYTGSHNRLESSNDKSDESPSNNEPLASSIPSVLQESESDVEKLPETPSQSEDSSDSSSSDTASKFEPDNSLNIIRQKEFGEQRKEDEIILMEGPEQDILSSCSSDDLPDLNDPSWGKEMKKKQVKLKKKKKEWDTQRTDTKLMKNARKAFQCQAIRYKSSKEFMKFKESQNAESSNCAAPSYHKQALQEIDNTIHIDSIEEGSSKSSAELMSLKLKESMAKYVAQQKANSVPDDVTHLRVHSSNAFNTTDDAQLGEQQSINNELEDSHNSDDSSCTVLFDDTEINEIYPIESAHTMTEEMNSGDRDSAALADGNSNSKKRKDSPLKDQSIEVNKKVRQEDKQVIVREVNANQQPMVVIPISISNPISLSSAVTTNPTASCFVSPVTHARVPLKDRSHSVDSLKVVQSGKKSNIQTDVKEKEASELHCNNTPVISMEDEENCVGMVDTQNNVSYPSRVTENECIHIGSSTYQESDNNANEDLHVINEVSIANSNESMTCSFNPVITSVIHEKTSIQEQPENTTNSIKQEPVGSNVKSIKSLKELSLHFKDLTKKRLQCEKKIKLVKEEYNKKLEALEEEKRNVDVEMVATMSEWRERSDEEHSVPDKQQESAAPNPSAAQAIHNTPVSIATANTTAPTSNIVTQAIHNIPMVMATTSTSAPTSIAVVQAIQSSPTVMATSISVPTSIALLQPIPPSPMVMATSTTAPTSIAVLQPIPPSPVVMPTTNTNENRNTERKSINIIPAASMKNFGRKKYSGKKKASSSALPQPKLSLLPTAAVRPSHLQEKRTTSLLSQVLSTPLPSSSGSENCSPTNSAQLRSDSLQYSVFDKRPPPNAVVIPGQQHPVVTSSHTLCRAIPLPQTSELRAQRRDVVCRVVKAAPNSNPRSLNVGYKNPVSSQTQQLQNVSSQLQQKRQYTPLQIHQQHPQQQQTQEQPHQVQLLQDQQLPQQQTTQRQVFQLLQGQHLPQQHTAQPQVLQVLQDQQMPQQQQKQQQQQQQVQLQPSSNTRPAQHQPNNCQSYQQQYQPVQEQPQNTTTTPLQDGGADQPAASTLHTGGNFSKESHVIEPICVMCGSTGVFTCCNDIIYCSTKCQGNDWSVHQHKCTNTAMPDAS